MLTARIAVNFDKPIRTWDGFGVTYVETGQTRDYSTYAQDYGGFSCLEQQHRDEILDLIFGADGLRPGISKMFLDPFHQPFPANGYSFDPAVLDASAYDHETTTHWLRYFVKEGVRRVREWGGDLTVFTTLYGPPGWMTRQGFIRGRDLDPQYKTEAAKYLIAWVKFLREHEGIPVRYISLHNEGEDWPRWPVDGSNAGGTSHDYNLYWPPEQVVDFLKFMPDMLRTHGLEDIGLTPGETTGWYRFHSWGYADAIADDDEAINNLGLITSHGFYNGSHGHPFFNDWRSAGIDTLREKRPDLHAWVTSTSWSNMDVRFVNELRNSIYTAKVNAITPWACVQLDGHWTGGDPNPGTAIRVYEDGRYEVMPGYYFYKQISCAGQPGTAVCKVAANDRSIGLVAFGANGSPNPDAFLVLNLDEQKKDLKIQINGSAADTFHGYRTSFTERYCELGEHQLQNGVLTYTATPLSVTTFFAR